MTLKELLAGCLVAVSAGCCAPQRQERLEQSCETCGPEFFEDNLPDRFVTLYSYCERHDAYACVGLCYPAADGTVVSHPASSVVLDNESMHNASVQGNSVPLCVRDDSLIANIRHLFGEQPRYHHKGYFRLPWGSQLRTEIIRR